MGNKNAFTYGTPTGLDKPVLGKTGPSSGALDQLKRALAAKADAGDAKAQFALGGLYKSGALGPDGTVQHDYSGAAYWYQQASDHGNAQAAYELAILYRDGLGVRADTARSFQLLQKSAEANYVPAMPLLSDLYADQKSPVSAQRATYWATKAAEAGEPRGWLTLGFEYASGQLGGSRPYWYQMAMDEFRKAADGGSCVAMMAIADLYAKGNGVPTDKAMAQSWQAKAEKCQNGNLWLLQQRITQYRAKAAAARQPVAYPMLDAIPVIQNFAPPVARNGHHENSGQMANIAVGIAVVVAIAALIPHSAANAGDSSADPGSDSRLMDNLTCGIRGGTNDVLGTCSR